MAKTIIPMIANGAPTRILADIAGVSIDSIEDAIRSGELHAVKCGDEYSVPYDEAVRFLVSLRRESMNSPYVH